MYKKILLAYDGSADGHAALGEAGDLALFCGAEVVLLAVVDIGLDTSLAAGVAPGGAVGEQVQEIREILAEGGERLRRLGVSVKTDLAAGHPGERIGAVARDIRADLIVLGHRQHGMWSRWTHEPVAGFLLRDPPCSVLVSANPPARD